MALLLGWGLGRLWPIDVNWPAWSRWIGWVLADRVAGAGDFSRPRVSTAPHGVVKPLGQVDDDRGERPFRYTRNPMYVSLLVLQVGGMLAFRLPWAAILLVPVFLALHFGVIVPEEAVSRRGVWRAIPVVSAARQALVVMATRHASRRLTRAPATNITSVANPVPAIGTSSSANPQSSETSPVLSSNCRQRKRIRPGNG